MKSKLIINLFFLVVLFSCNDNEDMVVQTKPAEEEEYCKNPVGLLTEEEAKTMGKQYNDNQHSVINAHFRSQAGDEYSDNKSFWYSLEELECYFSYIKHEADKKGYDSENMGVRIYLGAVPDEEFEGAFKTKVFFVPTGDKGKKLYAAQDNIYGISPKNLGDTDGGDY